MSPSEKEQTHRQTLGALVAQSTVLLMTCIGTLIMLLALLILFHENATATKGYQLRGLQKERSMLLLEQEVLNMQIAESQSLQHLQNDPQVTNMLLPKRPTYVHEGGSGASL
ncbi:MAG: hypothetical protein WCS85_01450 [Candidatus Peribacteraceae bacterium]|jgi:hypothetical protein